MLAETLRPWSTSVGAVAGEVLTATHKATTIADALALHNGAKSTILAEGLGGPLGLGPCPVGLCGQALSDLLRLLSLIQADLGAGILWLLSRRHRVGLVGVLVVALIPPIVIVVGVRVVEVVSPAIHVIIVLVIPPTMLVVGLVGILVLEVVDIVVSMMSTMTAKKLVIPEPLEGR